LVKAAGGRLSQTFLSFLLCGGSAVAESGVTGELLCQDLSCRCELVTDEAKAQEPGPHRVLLILMLDLIRACALLGSCRCAEGKGELNECLELSGIESILSSVCRGIELEEAELNSLPGKK